MSDDAVAQKITSLQRCVSQARKALADIVETVIRKDLDDLLAFAQAMRAALGLISAR